MNNLIEEWRSSADKSRNYARKTALIDCAGDLEKALAESSNAEESGPEPGVTEDDAKQFKKAGQYLAAQLSRLYKSYNKSRRPGTFGIIEDSDRKIWHEALDWVEQQSESED